MYKIQSVKIDNFWRKFDAYGEFNNDVNIIIGRNGSGKTTFMNILQSVLSVDIDGIANSNFDSVEIKLVYGNKTKTVKARKIERDNSPFSNFEYQISQSKHAVLIISSDDRRFSPMYRRRAQEDSAVIKKKLGELVSMSSLSVYRLRSGQDYEVRDRNGTRAISPVDYRLNELLGDLTHYQLELSQQARDIATKLQKDVLASILYSREEHRSNGYKLSFDKERERTSLTQAYKRLYAFDDEIKNKITTHVQIIDETIREVEESIKSTDKVNVDVRPLESLRLTQNIIKLSLSAEEKNSVIFAQIDLFLKILSDFITDKSFKFVNGTLKISGFSENVECAELSSGEKQLLILFIETLLQRKRPFIFLTDEPELSLHIEWQRNILPAIKQLNPNAQIIAATHSPEVASKYKGCILNMERLISG